MRLRRAIPAALVDAGAAALASFAIGLYAARALSASDLGAYALFFSAFLTVSTIPKQLVLVPGELRAIQLGLEGPDRLLVMPQCIRLSLAPAVVVSAAGAMISVILTGSAAPDAVLPLGITMTAAAVLQPVQAHVRRMMHLAGMSWHAGIVSIVQFLSAVAALVVLIAVGTAPSWIPFGAFFAANALSVLAALVVGRLVRAGAAPVRFRFRDTLRSGSKLVTVEFIPSISRFVASGMVLRIAGADVLGFAEAARIVARPTGVFADATTAPIRPRAFEAAVERKEAKGRRVSRIYALMLMGAGAAYLLVAGIEWSGNIMASLVPRAYSVTGLAAISIVAVVFEKISGPWQSQLIGGQRESSLIGIELVANACKIALAATAGYLQSFAVPISLLVAGVVRWMGRSRAALKMYASHEEPASP